MKIVLFAVMASVVFSTTVKAFDTDLLANNKESFSRLITKKDEKDLKAWLKRGRLERSELRSQVQVVLKQTMDQFEKRDAWCDLGLSHLFKHNATAADLVDSNDDYLDLLVFLRTENLIDDIFYQLLRDSAYVNADFELFSENGLPRTRPLNLLTRKNQDIDLKKFFSNFETWPDDIGRCSIGRFNQMANGLKWKNAKDRNGQLEKLIFLGVRNDVIDSQKFNRFKILLDRKVLDWHVSTKSYLDIVTGAKDKLAKSKDVEIDTDFSNTIVSRKQKLTQRSRLYKTYDSTQIIMLAELIDKTAKRMDARHVSLNFQYSDDPDGESESYVFSPMEQYRIAIRMLKKDMAELMRSDVFRGISIEYEDLVAAAYETGLIKSAELDYILKFEDFWNPQVPKWKSYASFAFSLASTASFYLPSPWNIVGALGLVVTQTKVLNGKVKPNPDNNWNTIL